MANADSEIQARVSAFVRDLEVLVRQAALAAVAQALGGSGSASAARGKGATKSARSNTPKAAAARSKGEKRDPKILARTVDQLLATITKKEGQGIEALAAATGVPSKDLTLPIKKLLKSGAISKTGEKRATKYFVGKGKAPAARKK